MPVGGARPQETQRALGVGQRRVAALRVAICRHPIGHHKQGVALGVENGGEVAALFIQHHPLIGAAGVTSSAMPLGFSAA